MPLLPALLLLLLAEPADAARPRRRAEPAKPPPPVTVPVVLGPSEKALVDKVTAGARAPAELVFLVETTGPMLDVAKEARDELAMLVNNVPEGDRVEILAYHTRVSTVVESTVVDAAGRSALVERIRTLDWPSAKDADLGAGLAEVARRLNRADVPREQFVYVLSTFCHNPSLSSEYDSGGRGCRAIRGLPRLVETFQKGREDRHLTLTLLGAAVPDRPAADAVGLAATQELLGKGTVVDPKATPFDAWAKAYAGRLPLERVLPTLRRQAETLALTVKAIDGPTATNPLATIEIASSATLLGVRLSGVTVEGVPSGSLPEDLELAPSATLRIPVAVPEAPFAVFPRSTEVAIPVSIRADALLLPDVGLAAVGIEPKRPGLVASGTVPYPMRYGLSWVTLIGILLAVAGTSMMGFMYLRRRFKVVRLSGTFTYRRAGGPRQVLDIASLAEVTVGIDENGELAANRGRRVLTLRVVEDGDEVRAEVDVHREGVEINRRPVRPGTHRVVPGATAFQFGEYRLSWE